LHQYFTEIGKEVSLTNEPWGISEVHPDPFVATLQLVMNRRRHWASASRAAKYHIALIDRFEYSTEAYQADGERS
jgi:thymidylate kinase